MGMLEKWPMDDWDIFLLPVLRSPFARLLRQFIMNDVIV